MKRLFFLCGFFGLQLSFAHSTAIERCRVKLWQTDLQGAVEECKKQGLLLGANGTCDGFFIVQSNVAGKLEVIEISVKDIPGERFVATRIPTWKNWIAAFKLIEEDVSVIRDRLGGEIPHVNVDDFLNCACRFVEGPEGLEMCFAKRWLR